MNKHIKLPILILCPILLSGCQATPTLPQFSAEDAERIEQALLSREENKFPPFELRYVQVDNHEEQCEVLVSDSFANKPGYRLYWDGKCRNGRAFGLGRVIQKSELDHFETITVFDEDHKKEGRIAASRNLVNYVYHYGVSTLPDDNGVSQFTGLYQHVQDDDHQFNMVSQYGEFGIDAQYLEGSPFHQALNYVDRKGTRARYKFTDRSNLPQDNIAMSFVLEDPRNEKNSVYAVHSDRQGSVRAYQAGPTGTIEATADENLLSALNRRMSEILKVATHASQISQQALNIESRYLERVCANPEPAAESASIDAELYTKVCTVQERQNIRYQATMEQAVAHAQSVYEQQKAQQAHQQQLQLQQQQINALQAQADAANRQARAIEQGNRNQMWMHNMNNINSTIQQNNNNLWQMNQQMLNSWGK